jgi:signal transduction histidine kinase
MYIYIYIYIYIRYFSSKNIRLVTTISSDVPHKVIGDSFQIEQILMNLLSNGTLYIL